MSGGTSLLLRMASDGRGRVAGRMRNLCILGGGACVDGAIWLLFPNIPLWKLMAAATLLWVAMGLAVKAGGLWTDD